MIINVDRKNRSINLSVKAKDLSEETEAMKQLRTENAAASAGATNLGALLRAKLDKAAATRSSKRTSLTRDEGVVMTKSELIARLAQRYPQLVAKDAEYAVKMILDAMTQALLAGQPHRDPRLRQLRAQLPPAAHRPQPEVGREGAGAGEVRAALQGRQGAARARRFRADGDAPAAPQRARFRSRAR